MDQSGNAGQEEEEEVLDLHYYKDIQLEIWRHDSKRTMITIFLMAAIIFMGDLIVLIRADLLTPTTLLLIMFIPLIFVSAGLLARREPLIAMIIAAILFAGIHILTMYRYGAATILSGWLIKAIMVYLILRGFVRAREAEMAKKNLKALQ